MRLSVPRSFFLLLLSLCLTVPAFAQPANQPTVATPEESKDTMVSVAGVQVAIDPVTGRLRPPTPEEARELAAGLKDMLNDSAEGLEQIQLPNGATHVDLEGRFMNVYVAWFEAEGGMRMDCVNSSEQAEGLVSTSANPQTNAGEKE